MAIFIAVALMFLLGTVVLVGSVALARSQLQGSADLAATAAAATLCSSLDCWEKSRIAALDAIEGQKVLSYPGASKVIQLGAIRNDLSDDTKVSWNAGPGGSDNLAVSLERGRWLPDSSAEAGFRSLEGTTSVVLPPYVAANAVRVKLTRPIVQPGLPKFINALFEVEVTATAIADRIGQTCAAPFAIPLCALLDNNGELNINDVDDVDRLFAPVKIYCNDDGTNCAYPAFPVEAYHGDSDLSLPLPDSWTPVGYADPVNPKTMSDAAFDAIASDTTLTGLQSKYALEQELAYHSTTNETPFWNTFRLDRTNYTHFDHFGVVGLPVGSQTDTVNEAQVRNALVGTDVCPSGGIQADIGDWFSILPAGLTSDNARNRMRDRLSGANSFHSVIIPKDNPQLRTTPLEWAYIKPWLFIDPANFYPIDFYRPLVGNDVKNMFGRIDNFASDVELQDEFITWVDNGICQMFAPWDRRGDFMCAIWDYDTGDVKKYRPFKDYSTYLDPSFLPPYMGTDTPFSSRTNNGACSSALLNNYNPRTTTYPLVSMLGARAWVVNVPIIVREGDNDKYGCRGVNGRSSERHIDPADAAGWKIAGFIRTTIYDYSIETGRARQRYGSWAEFPSTSNLTRDINVANDCDADGEPDWDPPLTLPSYIPPYNFELSEGGTQPASCDVVRGRLTPQRPFDLIVRTKTEGDKVVTLVE